MSFTLRATMANIALLAVFLGGWVSFNGIYIAIASVLFLLLILLNVANAIVDVENRAYWIGAAVTSCGVLMFAQYLPIFDAIAVMEDEKRMAAYNAAQIHKYSVLPSLPQNSAQFSLPQNIGPPAIPSQAITPAAIPISGNTNQVVAASMSSANNTNSAIPVLDSMQASGSPAVDPAVTPGSSASVPTMVFVQSAPAPAWRFAPVSLENGFTGLLKAFLICSGAYFLGIVGGLACARVNVKQRREVLNS